MMDDDSHLFTALKSHGADFTAYPEAPNQLRDAIYAKTRGTLRMRRNRRRAAYVIGIAAVYLAGVATTSAFTPAAPAAKSPSSSAAEPQSLVLSQAPSDQKVLTETELLDAEQVALRLRKLDNAGRAELLRETGDAYLRQHDLATALIYYRQHLDRVEPAERVRPDANDSWLLLSLKQGNAQEIRYANSNSH